MIANLARHGRTGRERASMSPSSSRRRPRRPPRPPRGRNRPPQRAVTAALVRSVLVAMAVGLIAGATYYGVQFFEQMRVEQRASVTDLSATGTIKSGRIAPPGTTPNDIVFAQPERIAPPELPARATTKHHRKQRAAHQRASRRHSVGAPPSAAAGIAPPGTTPAEQSPQLTSAPTTPDTGIANQ
jgi:hypothetical protein